MIKTAAGACGEVCEITDKSAKNAVITGKNAGDGEDMLYALEGERRESASPESVDVTPAHWMSPDLSAETHAVWSKRYGRSLEPGEVIEILANIRWFGELIRRGMNGDFQ